jgi:phage shock protein PspC (stress-responsive transcriptional regulator)
MHGENLITRDDTFLGVCEALGEDFRFNANWLRLAFGVSLLWNPMAVLGTYVGLGVIVALSRLISPNPRPAAAAQPVGTPGPVESKDMAEREQVALAA